MQDKVKAMFDKLVNAIHGGVKLTFFEKQCIRLCIKHLPDILKGIAEQQLNECNLIQREVDGRTSNYYKVNWLWQVKDLNQKLPIKSDDCVLLRLELKLGAKDKLNVTLHATNYRVFCVCFSQNPDFLNSNDEVSLVKCEQSWRSVV